MKKLLLVFACILTSGAIYAQEEATEEAPKEGWTRAGNMLLTFNQSAFNANWTGGGIGNTAANLLLTYDFNLLRGDWTWDNRITADYGVNKNKGQDNFIKNNDRLELNSLAGKKASGYWYYSGFVNFKTQFDVGTDANGNVFSHFFSPAYLQIGPGMLWKKHDNLKVNIAPATSRFIFVHSEFTDVSGGSAAEDAFNDAGGYFGVDANDTMRYELGASLQGYYKFNLMENISMENILNLYANYLDKPQNVDVDYTMNLAMKVNKYISANLVFQAIYDDNVATNAGGERGFQIREAFGIGVNYGF